MKIFYEEQQNAAKNESVSPSAGKPALVVADWLKRGYQIDIVGDFPPVTRNDFYKCHDPAYVNGVLDGSINNGFGNKIKEVNDALFYTSASMLAAAQHVFECFREDGLFTIACSPTSGFHHAGYYGYEGFGYFCTFNGLMLAAQRLHDLGADKIGIIDIDHHIGNGTIDIIEKLGIDYIKHYSFGEHFRYEKYIDGQRIPSNYDWKGSVYAEQWLNSLGSVVENFEDCDIVLYQAGADPHKSDPYGGALSTEQLRRRDRIVFNTLARMNTPVAWNLAGGYQEIDLVLEIHRATLEEGLRAQQTFDAIFRVGE